MKLKAPLLLTSVLALAFTVCLIDGADAFAEITITGNGAAHTKPCSGTPEPVSVAYEQAEQHAQAQCDGTLEQIGEPEVTEVDDASQLWTCGMGKFTHVSIEYECK